MSGLRIYGGKELEDALKTLRSTAIFSAMRSTMRAASRPIITGARSIIKREAEVSGNLRRSIGSQVGYDRRGQVVFAASGPRTNYTVSPQGKLAANAKSKADAERLRHPAVYGQFIENGVYGKRKRRAGGVHFMARAFDSAYQTSEQVIAQGVRAEILKRVAKAKKGRRK